VAALVLVQLLVMFCGCAFYPDTVCDQQANSAWPTLCDCWPVEWG